MKRKAIKAMRALCESPAEEAFVSGWSIVADENCWTAREDPRGTFQFWVTEEMGKPYIEHSVTPQYRVRLEGSLSLAPIDYRLDFLVVPRPGDRRWWNGYAIEIDGHKWHERTAEDAAYQRRRDRILIHRARILTIRFAAIEVLREPEDVAREVDEIVHNATYEDICAWQFGKPSEPR